MCGSSRLDAIEVANRMWPPTDRIYSYAMNVLECANNKIDCQCLVECVGGNVNGRCHGKAIKFVAIEKRAEHAREYQIRQRDTQKAPNVAVIENASAPPPLPPLKDIDSVRRVAGGVLLCITKASNLL